MALGLLLFAAAGPLFAAAAAHGDPFTGGQPLGVAFRAVKGVDGWLWVVAILGLARSRAARWAGAAARPGRLGAYASQAVLPFYLLHEPVIVVVACLVLPWRIGAGGQYLLISLASLAATWLLYDLGVRRTRPSRFLFGMKPTRPTRRTSS
jgi:hypothetical protein